MSEISQDQPLANPQTELSIVLVTLLKGVLYREGNSALWTTLLRMHAQAAEYMSALGLELRVSESEGYAYLKSRHAEVQEQEETFPRLIVRRALPFYDSLLLALLRKKFTEFDAVGTETRLVLKMDQFMELMVLYLPEQTDEVKLRNKLEQSVQRLQDMGFLRKLKATQDSEAFEVLRVIKAFIDGQWLDNLDKGLATFRAHAIDMQTT